MLTEPTDVTRDRAHEVLSARLDLLTESMRRREISPVDVVAEHIRRIEAVNPVLNCVVAERFAAARAEALEAERDYAVSARPRPLLGIPFTVKEMIEVSGMPLTFGSTMRRERKGTRDATVVARLREAGAILLGVTNVPEWGMWFESYNHIYGRTNNPYSVRHSPGGSSGGEGAAVGSGSSVFGLGSDIGGSVRMPAAFCGVFGHKPTTGLLPLTGHYPVYENGPDASEARAAPYVSIGTLTRSARDIAPLMRVMAGRDGIDPNAEPLAFLDPESIDWRGRRVIVLSDPSIRRASSACPAIGSAVQRAGHLMEERGAIVTEGPPHLFENASDVWFGALQAVGGASFTEAVTAGRGMWLELEVLRTLSGRGRYSWPALFFCIGERFGRKTERNLRNAIRESQRLAEEYAQLLAGDAVLITPVHPRSAPRHNGALLHPFDFLYTAVFNTLRVPATSAPLGVDARGLPLAVQFTSTRGNDHLTIAAASVVEDYCGPWQPPAQSRRASGRHSEPSPTHPDRFHPQRIIRRADDRPAANGAAGPGEDGRRPAGAPHSHGRRQADAL